MYRIKNKIITKILQYFFNMRHEHWNSAFDVHQNFMEIDEFSCMPFRDEKVDSIIVLLEWDERWMFQIWINFYFVIILFSFHMNNSSNWNISLGFKKLVHLFLNAWMTYFNTEYKNSTDSSICISMMLKNLKLSTYLKERKKIQQCRQQTKQ